MSFRASVLTLFPELFPGPLAASLAGRALTAGIWQIETIDIRTFGSGRHRSVDDTPYGGGAGMVLRADVVGRASAGLADGRPLVCLTPRGRRLEQAQIAALAAGPGVVLLAGRYEGIDQRVIEARGFEEVSIGDYVLSGGEIAAMVVLDAIVRLLPGVMGSAESAVDESFAAGRLEYPHYTRPAVWEGRKVPDVLLSGDHQAIARWRQAEAARLTAERRPDLTHGAERICAKRAASPVASRHGTP